MKYECSFRDLDSQAEEAWRRFASDRSERDREWLINHYMPIVKIHLGALNLIPTAMFDVEDRYSEGVIGLLRAIDTYDVSLGVSFASTYARKCIVHRAIREHQRTTFARFSRKKTGPRMIQMPVVNGSPIPVADRRESPHASLESQEFWDMARKCMSAREYSMFLDRYRHGMTMVEIGRKSRISRERVRQITLRAKRKFHAFLAGKELNRK